MNGVLCGLELRKIYGMGLNWAPNWNNWLRI